MPAPSGPDTLPRPEDVASIDGILAALYDTISGPAGAPRDWARQRSLFLPEGGRLIPVAPADPEAGESVLQVRVLTPEDYARDVDPILRTIDFYERETERVVQRTGRIAHVFSSYEARHAADGPVVRSGINSVQLVHDRGRWWIVSVLWDREPA